MDDPLLPGVLEVLTPLHRTDLAELVSHRKGKGKEGEADDEMAAFVLYEEELDNAEQRIGDRRMALSLDAAGREDDQAINEAEREEEAARRDRELAIALDGGRTQVSSSSGSTSSMKGSTNNSRSTLSTEPTTASSVASTSSLPSTVECPICLSRSPLSATTQVPCRENHHYCNPCLRNLFLLSTRDESLFPPGCDGTAIPLSLVKEHLSSAELALYTAKAVEFNTKNRLYCSTSSCSAFLGEAQPQSKVGVKCDACQASTCRACKAPWHGPFGLCGAEEDDEAAKVLHDQRGYQRCPSCKRVVELRYGCDHIYCLCGCQFCYACGASWKTCDCPLWDEQRLLEWRGRAVRPEVQLPAVPQGAVHRAAALEEAAVALQRAG
ncbi:hypothetical protein JCM10213_004451 [Rhodosporidiobolus nylandii]